MQEGGNGIKSETKGVFRAHLMDKVTPLGSVKSCIRFFCDSWLHRSTGLSLQNQRLPGGQACYSPRPALTNNIGIHLSYHQSGEQPVSLWRQPGRSACARMRYASFSFFDSGHSTNV